MSPRRPYHHGNLRAVLLEAAVDAVAEQGQAGWSLRDLARRAGVSHSAPAHHFGDKRGLMTVLATDGYQRLAAALEETWQSSGSFLEIGVAYVRFAIDNRSHFEVMFRPELVHRGDAALNAARNSSSARLYGPLEAAGTRDEAWDPRSGAIAAWSLVHGFATLWLNGSLPPDVGDDPDAAARRIASYLFRPMPDGMNRRDVADRTDPCQTVGT